MQCGNCQSFIAGDLDGRLPPWCPTCGADLNKKRAAATVASAPDQHPQEEEAPAALEHQEPPPPLVLPADQPYMPVKDLRSHAEAYLKRDPPGPSAAARTAMVVCTAVGVAVALVVAPRVFPQPAGGFSIEQMGFAGVLGGAAGAVGWLVGKVIDSGRG